jgi:probable F420-dependent oxidoreductase
MRFSIAVYDLPAREVVQVAIAADRCGFDTLWLGEHVVVPHAVASVHPTSSADTENPLRRPVLGPGTVLHDPWAVLGAVAGATTRIRSATGVLVLPLHHPLLVARAVATLHALSAGRFQLGVGSGWVAEEFAALDVPFEGRGRRLDASIELLRAALAGEPVGKPAVQVCDRAVEVPLVIGGGSPPALRRAARLGDGWLSSGAAGVDQVLQSRDVIESVRASVGRSHLPFRCFGRLPAPRPELVDRYRAEGVEDVVVWADHVWPRGAQLSWEQKRRCFRSCAEELGVRPARAA